MTETPNALASFDSGLPFFSVSKIIRLTDIEFVEDVSADINIMKIRVPLGGYNLASASVTFVSGFWQSQAPNGVWLTVYKKCRTSMC